MPRQACLDMPGALHHIMIRGIERQEEAYLKELVCYIHLNPMRAGIMPGIKELNAHPFSRHTALTAGEAKKAHLRFMEEGIPQGHREDLTGGGLIRSVGGWAEIKHLRRHRQLMSDERILGDSSFVEHALLQADEAYELKYESSFRAMIRNELPEG